MSNSNKPGVAFWVIGVIALLWNGMGVSQYLMQAFKSEAYTSAMNAEQNALMDSLPAWMTALFALAVFSGFIASIMLLMRKKMAVTLFLLSFVTATVQQLYWLFGTNAPEVFADMQPYFMPIAVIIVCIFLVWYSKDQKAKGVLS